MSDLLVFLPLDVNKSITICVDVLQDNITLLSLLWKGESVLQSCSFSL